MPLKILQKILKKTLDPPTILSYKGVTFELGREGFLPGELKNR
jgi:hypothetical protein